MPDWRDQHFGGQAATPQKAPPNNVRMTTAIAAMLILPSIGVGIAFTLGYFDPLLAKYFPPHHDQAGQSLDRYRDSTRHDAADQSQPSDSSAYTPAPITITQARANELRRIIQSRESGIDLLSRDQAKAEEKRGAAAGSLNTAKERLFWLERNRPHTNDSGAIYRWNLAHDDAIAAAKNATNTLAAQGKVVASFDVRITKATTEKDAAKTELHGAVIIP